MKTRTTVSVTVRKGGSGGIKRTQDAVATNTAQAAYNFARGVVAGAKRRAPVRTGRLRESIGRTRISEGVHVVRVDAPYGIYVEYGTRHMAPQPYFRPAVEEEKAKFYAAMRKVFKT